MPLNQFIYKFLFFLISTNFIGFYNFIYANTMHHDSMKLSNLKIATLPATIYNPDLSFFERTSDLTARYNSLAISFAEKNDIDFILSSGISYTSKKSSLQRLELLNNEKIDSDRFKNPKIIFIDNKKALQSIGMSSANSEVNKLFNNYQESMNIDIALNSAIYVSDYANKTEDFVNYYKKLNSNNTQKTIKDNYICILDINSIWKNDALKRAAKNNNPNSDTELIKKIDFIIANFAKSNDIDIILNGTYGKKICNITDSIHKIIDNDLK